MQLEKRFFCSLSAAASRFIPSQEQSPSQSNPARASSSLMTNRLQWTIWPMPFSMDRSVKSFRRFAAGISHKKGKGDSEQFLALQKLLTVPFSFLWLLLGFFFGAS